MASSKPNFISRQIPIQWRVQFWLAIIIIWSVAIPFLYILQKHSALTDLVAILVIFSSITENNVLVIFITAIFILSIRKEIFDELNVKRLFFVLSVITFVVVTFLLTIIFEYAFGYFYFGMLEGGSPPQSKSAFWDAIYLSVITWSTVGYGDITPTRSFSRIFASMEAINGYLIMGFFLIFFISVSNKIVSVSSSKNEVDHCFKLHSIGEDKIWVWKCRSCDTWAKITDKACGCRDVEWIAYVERGPGCDEAPTDVLGPKCKAVNYEDYSVL